MDQKVSKVVIIDHFFLYTSANKSHTLRIFTLLIFNLIERENSEHFHFDINNGEYDKLRSLTRRYIRMVVGILLLVCDEQ
jgi:hypothetical protein